MWCRHLCLPRLNSVFQLLHWTQVQIKKCRVGDTSIFTYYNPVKINITEFHEVNLDIYCEAVRISFDTGYHTEAYFDFCSLKVPSMDASKTLFQRNY